MGDGGIAGISGGGLSFRLGRIPVSMPWTGLAGVALIAFLWLDAFALTSSGPTETVVLAVVFAVLLYVSILGHELAHAMSARALGNPVHSITLWILGGFTSYERTEPSPLREGFIAASGPVSSVLIGFACLGASASGAVGDVRAVHMLHLLGQANVFLGIYNALPGLPLDGGAVLKSVVWGISRRERTGTVVAAWSGRVVAILVFALLVVPPLMAGNELNVTGVAFGAMISLFLYNGASEALRRANVVARVEQVSVRSLTRSVVIVESDLPLSEALRRQAELGSAAILVTDAAGRPLATVRDEAVAAVPLQRRPWVPVSSVAASLDPAAVLTASLTGADVIHALQEHPAAAYVVLDDDARLLGLLFTRDVERVLAGSV
jgi:Zn-dependent protease